METSEAKKAIRSSVIKTKIGLVITALITLLLGGYMGANVILQWEPMNLVMRALSAIFALMFLWVAALCLWATFTPSPIYTLIFKEPQKIMWVYTENVRMYNRETHNVNIYVCSANKKYFLLTTKKTVDSLMEILRAHAKNAHFGYDPEFEKKWSTGRL